MERQCANCRLPKYPEGVELSHGLCQACTKEVYPEYKQLHNVDDPEGTYYVQTGELNGRATRNIFIPASQV